jgi:hypothetical protein
MTCNCRQPRLGRCHQEFGVLLALVIGLSVGLACSLFRADSDNWFWDSVAALVWACVSFLVLVAGLALLTFLVFFVLFLIDLARAPSPAARGVLAHDFRVFSVLFFACVSLLLVLVLALPLLLLCVPIWLAALGLEGVEALRRVRTARRLVHLRRLSSAGGRKAIARRLRFAVRLLHDRDEDVRRQAFKAAASLLRHNPAALGTGGRIALEKALLDQACFVRAVQAAGQSTPLPALVTLGGKLGAGTAEKRTSPATTDPAVLAAWLKQEQLVNRPRRGGLRAADAGPAGRTDETIREVQVSIGYDTGPLPCQEERGKFLALYLFVTSTDLKRFQALMRRPTRDPNAAFGLLVRGDRVEVLYPGQCSGRRLDYVFPYPSQMSAGNLAEFLRQLQLLNLGLLLASAEESYRACFPEAAPPWLDARMRTVAQVYRRFERQLIAWLRRHDAFRDPELIYPLNEADHRERQEAFRQFRLEECLYPQYQWVVPLYGEDASWDRLLPPLRAVEGMMLHQGAVEGESLTRGAAFIRGLRLLGYRTATAIEEVLTSVEPAAPGVLLLDPFIDAEHEPATRHYLRAMAQAIRSGTVAAEMLPDAATFRSASRYYRVDEAKVLA